MIKDRLAALKAAQHLDEKDEAGDGGGPPRETAVPIARVSSGIMLEFFEQVDDLRSHIDRIAELVAEVKGLHNEILSSPQSDQRKTLAFEVLDNYCFSGTKGLLEEKMAAIKRTANDVRWKLKEASSKTVRRQSSRRDTQDAGKLGFAEAQPTEYVSAYDRMRNAQHATLSRKFVNTMTLYNKAQIEYREGCKARIQRQLEITGRTTTSDELEAMLESGNPAIFTKGIVIEAQDARRTLAEIEARHNDIMKLEASIRELHEMFMDMAMLVESQGEMIDRIEYNVSQSVNYIDSAKTDTRKAVKYQSAARKKKTIVAIIVTTAIAAIILIIIFATRRTGSSA